MRITLLSLYILLFLQGNAQDTVYAKPTLANELEFQTNDMMFLAGCAHGHICCAVGCQCCTELKRKQLYDTIYHPVRNGIQRITIVERYQFASSHERGVVHFRFKNASGELSGKWYRADIPYHYGYDDGIGFSRYPREKEDLYLKNNAVLVQNEQGDFYRIDLEGKILPMLYHSMRQLDSNVFLSMIIINNQRVYGFSTGNGEMLSPLTYSKVYPFNQQGLALIVNQNSLFGLVNCSGKLVLPCSYEKLEQIGVDRYAATLNGKTGIITSDGRALTGGIYQTITHYSDGLAFAQVDKNTFVYLDSEGKEFLRVNADWTTEFHEGMAAVFSRNKWGYIDRSGKRVIDPQFDRALPFENGVAPVAIKNKNDREEWGLIDRSGNFISDKRYAEIYPFKNGLARVFINGSGYGLVDTKGNEVMPCKFFVEGYGSQTDWFLSGTMIRSTVGKVNSYELVDRNGTQLLNLDQYLSANYVIDYRDGMTVLPYLLVTKKNGKRMLIDYDGNEILRSDYERIAVYTDKYATVQNGKTMYLIDLTNGKSITEIPVETYFTFEDDIIMIETTNYPRQYTYYDLQGNVIEVYGM